MRIRADFNGLFGEILCFSHEDTCVDAEGMVVVLREGMILTAFDEDMDEDGNRDESDRIGDGGTITRLAFMQWVALGFENRCGRGPERIGF